MAKGLTLFWRIDAGKPHVMLLVRSVQDSDGVPVCNSYHINTQRSSERLPELNANEQKHYDGALDHNTSTVHAARTYRVLGSRPCHSALLNRLVRALIGNLRCIA